MSNAPTIYPFRQALNETLRHLILTAAVPAINADLSGRFESTGAGSVPQFDDSSVSLDDLMNISQPTICIVRGGEDNVPMASEGQFLLTLRTQIRIKTLYAGSDSDPEDYAFFFSSCVDNLRDLLTSAKNLTLAPVNPATGKSVLPGGQKFMNCRYLGERPINFPVRGANGVTRTRGTLLMHQSEIQYSLNRPLPLGG